jgi:hypothetical protein
MRLRSLVVLALALIPAIGRAQDKSMTASQNTESQQELPKVLRIVELGGETTSLKWSDVQTTAVTIPLSIVNDGRKPLSARLTATPFLGSAAPAAVQLNGQSSPLTLSLGVKQPVSVNVSATLPAAGTYRSMVEVSADGVEPLRVTLEMERKRVEVPIELTGVAARRIDVWPWRDASAVTFDTTISSIGDPLSLAEPTLHSVTYTTKADGSMKVVEPDVKLQDGSTMQLTSAGNAASFTLTGIPRAGRYDANVRLTGTGFIGKDVTLTVYAREPWWLAVLAIALGLAVSILLRTFSNFTRPRLQNEQRAATLFAELQQHGADASGDEASVAVVQQIRRALTDHWNDLVAKGKLTDLTALDVYDEKVRLLGSWIALRKRVKTLKPPSVQKTFRGQLEDASAVLLDTAATSDHVKAQSGVLVAMPGKIDQALEAALTEQIKAFRQIVDRDSRGKAQAIAAELKQIEATTPRDLPAALVAIDDLQRRYYLFCLTELNNRIQGQAPTGVLPGEWNAATTLVSFAIARSRTARTGAEVGEAFRDAWRTVLETTADGLARAVAHKIANSKTPQQYEPIKARVDRVFDALKSGELHKASSELDGAIEAFATLQQPGTLGALEDAALTALTGLAGTPEKGVDIVDTLSGGASAETLQQPGAVQMIGATAASSLRLFVFAVIVLAILTGVKALWIDDWVWGGWPSYLAAFLWGVAFDQFSHAGLTALIRR